MPGTQIRDGLYQITPPNGEEGGYVAIKDGRAVQYMDESRRSDHLAAGDPKRWIAAAASDGEDWRAVAPAEADEVCYQAWRFIHYIWKDSHPIAVARYEA